MSAGEASDGSKEVYVLLRYVVLAGDGMRFFPQRSLLIGFGLHKGRSA